MSKTALILEGGAFRGIYTMGVIDTFLENNIDIDLIIGVSAGALFGINYFSKQKGRALRYTKKYYKDKRYMSKRSLFLTGNIINKNFAFYKVTKKLDKFDNEEFKKNKKDFYCVATNVETGLPEYLKVEDVYEDLELFRATSAMPLASKMIKINGKKYLDGGISDSIPINKCLELGYEKIIVVLTQPLNYKKKPLKEKEEKLINFKFKKYPKLIDTMKNRYLSYNKTIDDIKEKEDNKEIFVIRPSKKIRIDMLNCTLEEIDDIYNLGVDDTNNIISSLKEYLK